MDITVENAFIILKKYLENLNKDKFEHSIRVAQTSKILAQKWDTSVEDAIIAGLLHDIGKSMKKREMLDLCTRNGVTLYDFELFANLSALHGKVSSLLFESEFNKDDIERFNSISHAISNHVAGNESLTLLDKVIFIADNIEPNRGNDILSKIQSGEITSPDECIKMIINDKLERAKDKGRESNPLLNCTPEDSLDDERER